jgi:hypothetical protein
MAKNWLFIKNGVVKQIVTQDDTPTPGQAAEAYDTLAQDDSQTFIVGDVFTAELQLQHNKAIWIANSWLPTPEQEAAGKERQAAIKAALEPLGIRVPF